jgi:hypothetical protein
MLTFTMINFGFGMCNHMPSSRPWEIHLSSNMRHAGCNTRRAWEVRPKLKFSGVEFFWNLEQGLRKGGG